MLVPLHLARGDLVNIQPGLRDDRHRRAARLAHDDGRFQILREEQPFHHANGRRMFLQHVAERLGNFGEATGARPVFRAGNGSVRQDNHLRSTGADDPKTRAAQRRVNAKNRLRDA